MVNKLKYKERRRGSGREGVGVEVGTEEQKEGQFNDTIFSRFVCIERTNDTALSISCWGAFGEIEMRNGGKRQG